MSKALELGNKYKSLLAKYGITTPLRLAHFFSQIAHESGGFKYLAELGGKSYFDKYEGRKGLGNTQKGDGYKFKGRGYFQVNGTWITAVFWITALLTIVSGMGYLIRGIRYINSESSRA